MYVTTNSPAVRRGVTMYLIIPHPSDVAIYVCIYLSTRTCRYEYI